MANLPTSIKNLNTLLGEQLTEGGGGAEPLIIRFTGETETVHDDIIGDITYDLVDKTPTEVFTALNGGRPVLIGQELFGKVIYALPATFCEGDFVSFADGDTNLSVLPSGKLGKGQGGQG